MAIQLNDSINVTLAKPTDSRYGPYASTSAALSAIPSYQRYKGLVVGVLVAGSVTDYWFQAGTANGDLVEKTSGSGGSSSFDTLPNPTKELFDNNTSISAATINLDLSTKQVYYYSEGATGNFTVNFRGDSSTSLDTVLKTGEMISSTLIVKNGANAYLANVVKVDSATINAYWFDPSPAGTPNGLDVYSFTILKTAAATFEVIVNIAPAATL